MGKAQETLGGGTSTVVRAAGAWTWTVVLYRWRADRLVRGPNRGQRPRLAGPEGRVLPAREQNFALGLKQARFDPAGTMKVPKKTCPPIKERKLDHPSRIHTDH